MQNLPCVRSWDTLDMVLSRTSGRTNKYLFTNAEKGIDIDQEDFQQ